MENSGVRISDEEWIVAVKRRLGDSTDFKIVSIDWGIQNTEMKGFLGDHLTVKVFVLINGHIQPQQLDFFIKTVPKNSEFAERFISSTSTFDREVSVFSTILEEFREHELVYQKAEQLKWAPECYYTRSDLLIMENLVVQGFKMSSQKECLDLAHCKLVLSALAHLHAVSIAYEEKQKMKMGQLTSLKQMYPETFSDVYLAPTDGSKNILRETFKTTIEFLPTLVAVLEKYGEHSDYYKQIMEKWKPKTEKMFDLIQPSRKYRNVFCHGDIWFNNVMFRYGQNDNPEEVRMVDFQMARYLPPASDIFMFLHQSTSREFRRVNLESLLSLYYEEFTKVLQHHHVDTDVLSWKEFCETCEEYGHYGHIMAVFYHSVTLMPNEILQEAVSTSETYEKFMLGDRNTSMVYCFKQFPKYRKRMTDDIEELIEHTILEL